MKIAEKENGIGFEPVGGGEEGTCGEVGGRGGEEGACGEVGGGKGKKVRAER